MSNIQGMSAVSCCGHSNHLFNSPLCQNQTLLRKIANVAFHILTLGIPLAVYHIVSCCFSRRDSNPNPDSDLRNKAIGSVIGYKTSAPEGQVAIQFTMAELQKNPGVDVEPYSGKLTEPVNPDLAKLKQVYLKHFYKPLEDAIKNNKTDPWNSKEVLEAADKLMKAAYTISVLTLEDLKEFSHNLSERGMNRTYVQALTAQDSYQYRTFYYAINAYYTLRRGDTWKESTKDSEGWGEDEGLFPRYNIPNGHADPFYQEGTIQNGWRTLFNEYCNRVRMYVSEKELSQADSRHFNWTQKDTDKDSFLYCRDTQPT